MHRTTQVHSPQGELQCKLFEIGKWLALEHLFLCLEAKMVNGKCACSRGMLCKKLSGFWHLRFLANMGNYQPRMALVMPLNCRTNFRFPAKKLALFSLLNYCNTSRYSRRYLNRLVFLLELDRFHGMWKSSDRCNECPVHWTDEYSQFGLGQTFVQFLLSAIEYFTTNLFQFGFVWLCGGRNTGWSSNLCSKFLLQ